MREKHESRGVHHELEARHEREMLPHGLAQDLGGFGNFFGLGAVTGEDLADPGHGTELFGGQGLALTTERALDGSVVISCTSRQGRTYQDLARAAEVNDVVTRAISGHATETMQRHYSTVSDAEMKQGLAKVVSLAGFKAANQFEDQGGVLGT